MASILPLLALTAVGALLTNHTILIVGRYTAAAGLCGKDLNKSGAKEDKPNVPEALGLAPGIITVLTLILYETIQIESKALPAYNAALHSLSFTLLLGFADDVLDLPWRYKLILPTIGTLPLLVAYDGGTSIIVPKLLRFTLPKVVNLGVLYYVYMSMLAVFCTNAINIYAGINGLEAGQSVVIGIAVIIHNIIELNGPFHSQHFFSLVFIMPFVASTLVLLRYNWYPSRVFVGDTFCYFAGATFAVTGILGHFSKTLLLFFIPQIINFVYSLPQMLLLFGLSCPRHRLPHFNPKTRCLEAVKTNMNLINLWLWMTGPLHERTLCISLLTFQSLCCAFGFFVRYVVADYFY